MLNQNQIPNTPLPDLTELIAYRIVKMIARGSSSFVYLAKNDQDQCVAIKEYIPQQIPLRKRNQLDLNIPPERRNEFRKKLKTFFSEFRTLSRLDHSNIVRLIDFFRAHNTFYLVISYEPGSSLRALLHRRFDRKMGYKTGSLTHAYLRYRRHKKRIIGSSQIMGEPLIKKIFCQVIDAMEEVHAQGLLHLDLKPENIHLDYKQKPCLIDFGSARRAIDKNRKQLNWVYTQGYAAPELSRKQSMRMGPWTDVYNVGASIFACMCGYAPQSAIQREIRDEMPRAFKALRRLYSPDLVNLVECCLQLDREKRPQSMSALHANLIACQYRPPKPLLSKHSFPGWLAKLKKYRVSPKHEQRHSGQ